MRIPLWAMIPYYEARMADTTVALRIWDGTLRCETCGHECQARLPLKEGQSIPCVHLTCSNCHKDAAVPVPKGSQC